MEQYFANLNKMDSEEEEEIERKLDQEMQEYEPDDDLSNCMENQSLGQENFKEYLNQQYNIYDQKNLQEEQEFTKKMNEQKTEFQDILQERDKMIQKFEKQNENLKELIEDDNLESEEEEEEQQQQQKEKEEVQTKPEQQKENESEKDSNPVQQEPKKEKKKTKKADSIRQKFIELRKQIAQEEYEKSKQITFSEENVIQQYKNEVLKSLQKKSQPQENPTSNPQQQQQQQQQKQEDPQEEIAKMLQIQQKKEEEQRQKEQEKQNKEREIFHMQNEDFLSSEVEEYLHQQQFIQKNVQIRPNFPQIQDQPSHFEGMNHVQQLLQKNMIQSQSIPFQPNLEIVQEKERLQTVHEKEEDFLNDQDEQKETTIESLFNPNQTEKHKQTMQKVKKICLRMQNITDLKGIENLQKLQILTLSMNKIHTLTPLQSCQNLTELNLSQNTITSYSALNSLPNLQKLNLEINQITQISHLNHCKNLEILNLNHNKILTLDNLFAHPKLKILKIFNNKLQKIENLNANLLLEELDLGNNAIEAFENLKENIFLKKLVLSSNKITEIQPKQAFFFLFELYLNKNQIKDVSNLFYFPCLEILDLSQNKLEILQQNQEKVLPNLKNLNLRGNSLNNFYQIWNYIQQTPKLNYLNYENNEFHLNFSSENVLDLFDFQCLSTLKHLKSINGKEQSQGLQSYFQQRFKSLLVPSKNQQNQLQKPSKSKKESLSLLSLFTSLSHTNKHLSLFSQKKLNLRRQNYLLSPNFPNFLQNFRDRNLKTLQNPKILQNSLHFLQGPNKNIYFELNFFNNRQMKAKYLLLKLFKKVLKTRKNRLEYHQNTPGNLQKILKIQAFSRGHAVRNKINLKQVLVKLQFLGKAKFALKIQKVYRGYRLRKKMKELMKDIQYDSNDDLESLDDSWMNKEPEFNDQLDMDFDFNNILGAIASSQQQQQQQSQQQQSQQQSQLQQSQQSYQQQQQYKEQQQFSSISSQNTRNILQDSNFESKNPSFLSQQKQKQQSSTDFKQQNNDFLTGGNSMMSSSSQRRSQDNEYQEQVMKEWGFSNPDVAVAFSMKKQKLRKIQHQKQMQNMTAEQRLQKFKKNFK